MKVALMKYAKRLAILVVVVGLISKFIVPVPKIGNPTSTVLLDRDGNLLGARIARDGQWRFPHNPAVPERFEVCLTQFEDEYFRWHPGVNPVSIWRAFRANLKAGTVVQGGSTLTMQTARIIMGNPPRTYWNKFKELCLTIHLEINLTKTEILALYCANAPFGGNVVGLDAASWRYFNRPPDQLSWSEYAALAVLPNAPGVIYPGVHSKRFRSKRDHLLHTLVEKGIIDEQTHQLSLLEPLPSKPHPLPDYALHATNLFHAKHHGEINQCTIRKRLQQQAQMKVNNHCRLMAGNEVYNAAVIVVDVATQQVLAYVGNSTHEIIHQNAVDVASAGRSSGSILKPLLYAASIGEGHVLPNQWVDDLPTSYGGYRPKNYYASYDGVVPLNEALYRSLNVPFVDLLHAYGVSSFHQLLRRAGHTTVDKHADHYGLSLILGGAEVSLENLVSNYSGMARALKRYNSTGEYDSQDYQPLSWDSTKGNHQSDGRMLWRAGSIYQTFSVMTQVARPVSESGWQSFGSTRKIAWKTGTSFGHRDAWAVGVTPEFVVGVWVGNADGEGRTGLTGTTAAAPLLFDVFQMLPNTTWFEQPYNDMDPATICKESGLLAGVDCPHHKEVMVPRSRRPQPLCSYHQKHLLDSTENYRVTAECALAEGSIQKSWLVLSPAQQWFYQNKHPLYRPLPKLSAACTQTESAPMEFIYPTHDRRVFIPQLAQGKKGEVVFEVAHNNINTQLFWHLDDVYLGATTERHQMACQPSIGQHTLLVVDQLGREIRQNIEVLSP